jgi:hypothetical protein
VAVNSVSSSLSSGDLMSAETRPSNCRRANGRMPTVLVPSLYGRLLKSISDRSNQKFRLYYVCEGKKYLVQRPSLASFRGGVSKPTPTPYRVMVNLDHFGNTVSNYSTSETRTRMAVPCSKTDSIPPRCAVHGVILLRNTFQSMSNIPA